MAKDKARYYDIDGMHLPSVTSITGLCYPKPWLANWRGAVGNKAADKRSKEATDFGKDFHELIQKHLEKKPYSLEGKDKRYVKCFTQAKNWLEDQLEDIYFLEQQVHSKKHKYAGRVDLIGQVKSAEYLVLLDWKTGKRMYDDYPIQISAYAQAAEESLGLLVTKAVVVRLDDPIDVRWFDKRELLAHQKIFLAMIPIFNYYIEMEAKYKGG